MKLRTCELQLILIANGMLDSEFDSSVIFTILMVTDVNWLTVRLPASGRRFSTAPGGSRWEMSDMSTNGC